MVVSCREIEIYFGIILLISFWSPHIEYPEVYDYKDNNISFEYTVNFEDPKVENAPVSPTQMFSNRANMTQSLITISNNTEFKPDNYGKYSLVNETLHHRDEYRLVVPQYSKRNDFVSQLLQNEKKLKLLPETKNKRQKIKRNSKEIRQTNSEFVLTQKLANLMKNASNVTSKMRQQNAITHFLTFSDNNNNSWEEKAVNFRFVASRTAENQPATKIRYDDDSKKVLVIKDNAFEEKTQSGIFIKKQAKIKHLVTFSVPFGGKVKNGGQHNLNVNREQKENIMKQPRTTYSIANFKPSQTLFHNFSPGLKTTLNNAIVENNGFEKISVNSLISSERTELFLKDVFQSKGKDRLPFFKAIEALNVFSREKRKGNAYEKKVKSQRKVSGGKHVPIELAESDSNLLLLPTSISTFTPRSYTTRNAFGVTQVQGHENQSRSDGRGVKFSSTSDRHATLRNQNRDWQSTRPSIAFPITFESILTSGLELGSLSCACVGLPASVLLFLGLWLNLRYLLLVWIVNMTIFVALDLLYILHSMIFFWSSNQQSMQASGPEFAMYHTVNFFVFFLNVYAILCVTSQYQEITASDNLPRENFGPNTLPRATTERYNRHSFVTRKKFDEKNNSQRSNKKKSACVETTFVSKTDSVVSYKEVEKTGRRNKSQVSFTNSEALKVGGSQPIQLADARANSTQEGFASTGNLPTDQKPAEILFESSQDLYRDNNIMDVAVPATKMSVESHLKAEVTDLILPDIHLPEGQQLILSVHRLKNDAVFEDTSLIKRRQTLRFNSLQPLQKLSVGSAGLHFSSLSLNYPKSPLPLEGHDFETPLLTAPLNHSKLPNYKINFFPKTPSEHDKQPLERDYLHLSSEQNNVAVTESSRLFPNVVNKFSSSSPRTRSSLIINTKNARSPSYASLQEPLDGRSASKSVYFNSTVEEVVFVDFADNTVESSFDCSESTSSTCSGSSEEDMTFNSG